MIACFHVERSSSMSFGTENASSAHFPKFALRLSGTFCELRKAMGTSKSMILVPLVDLRSLEQTRRLRCRDLRSAVLDEPDFQITA